MNGNWGATALYRTRVVGRICSHCDGARRLYPTLAVLKKIFKEIELPMSQKSDVERF